jgi:nucleotide-binding universal stress UspA family protein
MFIVERGSAAHAQDHPRRFRPLNVAKVDLRVFGETEPQLASRRGGKDVTKDVTDVEGEHRVLAEQAARAAVAELDGDVEVEVDAYLEDPADSLIGVSENLDPLVCSSRGYGPLRAVLLGGVSRRAAAESHRPVIVLPRGVEAPLTALMASALGTGLRRSR